MATRFNTILVPLLIICLKSIMKKIQVLLLIICLLYAIGCNKASDSSPASSGSSGTGGSLAKFTISQGYLYVVDRFQLYTYNLSDPSNPSLVNTTFVDAHIETIFPYKDKLFIATTTGMDIYSITNANLPVKLGTALHLRSCDPIVANDSVAFVTLSTGTRSGPATEGLYVQDIRNILQPVLKKTLPMSAPYGLGLKDTVLYVCCRQNGLKVFNVTDAYNPILINTLLGETFMDVIPLSNLLICYVGNGISLYDISSPQLPQLIKKINN